MRRLVVSTFVSLDGVAQAPGGPEEDETGGFSLGGWTVPHFDEAVGAFMDELMGTPFDLVLGRRTYEIFAGHWPHAGADEAGPLNAATKHVASRGRPDLPWGPAVLLDGDVVEGVRALKEQDGPELQVHGSIDLLQTLLGADLVDEHRLLTFPVILGQGKRLFGDGPVPGALRLRSSSTSATGVTMAVYEAAGAVTTGSFALEHT
jgi:dihydrofolate reductase